MCLSRVFPLLQFHTNPPWRAAPAFFREILKRIIPSSFGEKAAGSLRQMGGVFWMRLAKLPWSTLGTA
jgi:hypothetical protein